MFERITLDPAVMAGMPCIRGMRVPVATVVGMVAEGMTTDEILDDFPYLEREDIAKALQYAAEAVRERRSWQTGEVPGRRQPVVPVAEVLQSYRTPLRRGVCPRRD